MSITPESVKEMLSSEDLGDRLRAVNQIRDLEPAIGFELAQSAVTDTNARVRYSAVSLFDTLGKQDLDASLNILRDRLLNDPEADVQAAAADCLGALKLHAAFEDMQQVYRTTPEWLVKFSIVATLGELGDPRAFELLKEALSSDNDLVKTAAISSFGELGDAQAIPLLAPYASNPDWQVRYRLVQSLNLLGGADAKSILETLATDEVEAIATEAKNLCSQLKAAFVWIIGDTSLLSPRLIVDGDFFVVNNSSKRFNACIGNSYECPLRTYYVRVSPEIQKVYSRRSFRNS